MSTTKQLEEQVTIIRSALEKNLESGANTRDELAEAPRGNQHQAAHLQKSERQLHPREEHLHQGEDASRWRSHARANPDDGTGHAAHGRQREAGRGATRAIAARPRVGLNLALGALVGLVVGLGLAFFIEYLDTSVKTMEDVESLLGVPVLAIIPKNIKLLHKEAGRYAGCRGLSNLAHEH